MNILKNIKPIHGFYDLNGDEYLYPNDKYIGGDTYKTEDLTIYVHKDCKTATMVNIGFKYDKCSKSILKRGGILTAICRNHDGWYGAEYLSLIKANNEMYYGMRLLKQSIFRSSYHWLFTTLLGYPFRWFSEKFKGVSHSDKTIKENRKFVRLFRWDEKNKRWIDISDKQSKWNGDKL